MIYSRCLYLVMLQANERARQDFPAAKGEIYRYFKYACERLKCQVMCLCVDAGCIKCLVDLNVDVSICDFFEKIKICTAAWIAEKCGSPDSKIDYWGEGCYFKPIAMEDKEAAINFVEAPMNSEDLVTIAEKYRIRCYEDGAGCDELISASVCHHIIIITSRSRVILPVKHRLLLAEIIKNIAFGDGVKIRVCSSMRNHVHILCYVSPRKSITNVVDVFKSRILEAMRANPRFRKAEEWSDDSVVFAVSDKRIAEEENVVMNQDMIHWYRRDPANEMSHLYRKLDITYVTSLN